MPSPQVIGVAALIVGILALAQRLGGWESKKSAKGLVGVCGVLALWWLTLVFPLWTVGIICGVALAGVSFWTRGRPLLGRHPHGYWVIGIVIGALTIIGSGSWAARAAWIQNHKTVVAHSDNPVSTSPTASPNPTVVPLTPRRDQPKIAKNNADLGSPIDGLTKLGWTVVATGDNPTVINFQQARRPLPDMVKSARYMKELKGKLDVGIIEASSLAGLSQLSTVGSVENLRLAGNFPNLDELRSFKQLPRLDLIGGSTLNLGPVGSLTQLRELILQQPHDKSPDLSSLGALVNLRKFLVYGFALTEIPALRTMKSLNYLDLTGTPVNDLSGLRDLSGFSEFTIDQRSIPAMSALANRSVRVLRIRHPDGLREPIDLVQIASLQNLKTLDVTSAGSLTLTPLKNLQGLSELIILGTEISFADFGNFVVRLVDPATIGELHGLKKLGLSWVDIRDTNFMDGLGALEEVYINQTRSLSDIRTLGTLQTLRSVQLVATSVVDISPLLNLRRLKVLTVQATPARLDVITELQNKGVTVKQ